MVILTELKGMDDKEGVKSRLKRALALAGLTQSECSRIANVPRDFVHKAVQRGSVPNNKSIRNRISKALKSSDSWLWFGMEDTNNSKIGKKLKISKEAMRTGKTKITIELDAELATKILNILKD